MSDPITNPKEKLHLYIRARYPLVLLQSHEETRVIASIEEMVQEHNDQVKKKKARQMITWSVTEGLNQVFFSIQEEENESDHIKDLQDKNEPIEAINRLLEFDANDKPTIFVFKDFHSFLNDSMTVRYMRDLANHFVLTRHTLILLSPVWGKDHIPAELQKSIVILDWPLPNIEELKEILDDAAANVPDAVEVNLNGNTGNIVNAMRGLTAFEAASALLASMAKRRSSAKTNQS